MSDPELKHNETESPDFDRELWDLAWRLHGALEESERKIWIEESYDPNDPDNEPDDDVNDYPGVDDTWVDGFMCGWLTRGSVGERPA